MKHPVYNAIVAGLAASVLLASAGSHAGSVSYSGSIQGQWTSPVLGGSLIDGATGAVTVRDNTMTASCNLSPCPRVPPNFTSGGASSTVAWGQGGAALQTSTIVFTGDSFANVAPGALFQLGTLTYANGTSDLDSLIFGATLTLTAVRNDGGPAVDPFVVLVGLTTTNNTGTAAQNADFVDFGNGLGTTQPVTFNVYEGATATAILSGRIVGDPMLFATQIGIAPGSSDAGFIGPLAVPEPSSGLLCLTSLVLLARLRARRA